MKLNQLDVNSPGFKSLRSVTSEPTSPCSLPPSFSSSFLGVLETQSRISYSRDDNQEMRLDRFFENSNNASMVNLPMWEKVAKWGIGKTKLAVKKNRHSYSDSNNKPDRVRRSTLATITIEPKHTKSENKQDESEEQSEEENLSWIDMVKKPVEKEFDYYDELEHKAELYYDDEPTRAKIKSLISATDFDNIIKHGIIANNGTRLDTIRVCLTPLNVKRMEIINSLKRDD